VLRAVGFVLINLNLSLQLRDPVFSSSKLMGKFLRHLAFSIVVHYQLSTGGVREMGSQARGEYGSRLWALDRFATEANSKASILCRSRPFYCRNTQRLNVRCLRGLRPNGSGR
jgi:hypothetical protein